MKHPGPYQKIAIDRRSFMPISTGKGMARASETTKRVRINIRRISNEKGNGRKGESLGTGQAGAIGANRPWVPHFISAGFGTSKRGWSAGGMLAWVWTCMDSIGTIHRTMVLWPVGSTSLEPSTFEVW